VELARASRGDSGAQRTIATALSDVARTAPDELLVSLRVATPADRDAALGLLAQGVAQQQDADHPLWPAVRKVMASTDTTVAAFGRELDATLSQRMAAEKAPRVVQAGGTALPAATVQPAAAPASTDRPGG
jgi:D-alanyl-D-alanine carboxypeptidase/D-alanyl-D-alanine-endopeptidase (penicillin-binding protein 4)